MKGLVAFIFCACIFVPLCNAACSISLPPELKEGEALKGCLHNGKLHELGTKWRGEDCLGCTCYSTGHKKCCGIERPVNYDPEKCVFVFDKETCKYNLIPNKDPEKPCSSYGMVG